MILRKMIKRLGEKWGYREIDNLIYTPALKYAYSSSSISGSTLVDLHVAITGVTGGIGKATAERFIKEGCNVILVGRDGTRLNELKNDIGNANTQIMILDLLKPEYFEENIRTLMKDHSIDVWVNCAGIFTDTDRERTFSQITKDQFFNTYNINFNSTALLTEIVAKEMKARNVHGKIINVASMAAFDQVLFLTVYGMSKSAIIAFTKNISQKYKGDLCIMGIAPGATVSRMSKLTVGDSISNAVGGLERLLIPEEVAATIAFMASSVGNYLNGYVAKIYAYNIL